MGLWGFLLSVVYVPGFTGVSIQTGWCFMSLTLVAMTWRHREPTLLHWLGLAFLLYAFASCWWAPVFNFGIFALWLLVCAAFAFMYGYQRSDLERLFHGVGIGLCVSSVVVIAQMAGYRPVLNFTTPAGLFYNGTGLAEASALVMIWALMRRYWLYLAPLALNIYASHNKGAVVALLIGIVALVPNRLLRGVVFTSLLIAAVAGYYVGEPSITERLAIWSQLAQHLTPFGHGAGALNMVAILQGRVGFIPEYAHNEFLDFIYTYGLGAVFALAVVAGSTLCSCYQWRLRTGYWPVWAAVLAVSAYSFPLHFPVTTALAACVAGAAVRSWHLAWVDGVDRGLGLLHRHDHARSLAAAAGGEAVPVS